MSDPLSIIAIAAAVGGTAGKFTEKAWDCGERWLSERFGSHAAKAQENARNNAASFIEELAKKIKVLEDKSQINPEVIAATEQHPQFSSLLQQTIINAAQTDDKAKHDLLSQLIANRLTSKAETTLSLASQLASDAIARSTSRQLMLMGLCSFTEYARPTVKLTSSQFRRWIETGLEPFSDFEFNELDARHLVAIACASYDPTSERDLILLLQMKGVTDYLEVPLYDLEIVQHLQICWGFGLAGVSLTSVGTIVGGLAFDQITGCNSWNPQWD